MKGWSDRRVDQRMFDPEAALLSGGAVCCQNSGALEKKRSLTKVWLTNSLFQMISEDSISANHLRRKKWEFGESVCAYHWSTMGTSVSLI